MGQDELPDPTNCVEFITEDGRRFAWSESNICYEEVPPDGGSFTLLRQRLTNVEEERDELAKAIREGKSDDENYWFGFVLAHGMLGNVTMPIGKKHFANLKRERELADDLAKAMRNPDATDLDIEKALAAYEEQRHGRRRTSTAD